MSDWHEFHVITAAEYRELYQRHAAELRLGATYTYLAGDMQHPHDVVMTTWELPDGSRIRSARRGSEYTFYRSVQP